MNNAKQWLIECVCSRKKAIKARLNTYSVEDFQTLFNMAEGSRFLKGQNSRSWSANFDWLIKDSNMAKVLDGNYTDNRDVREHLGKERYHDKIHELIRLCCPLEDFTQEQADYIRSDWGLRVSSRADKFIPPTEENYSFWDARLSD